jgi:hypothetical protein
MARDTEPFALLAGHLAYEGKKGPEVGYRFEWWAHRVREVCAD